MGIDGHFPFLSFDYLFPSYIGSLTGRSHHVPQCFDGTALEGFAGQTQIIRWILQEEGWWCGFIRRRRRNHDRRMAFAREQNTGHGRRPKDAHRFTIYYFVPCEDSG